MLAVAAATRAQSVPFGELEVRYDETPMSMGGGRFAWKGVTRIPLTRDDDGNVTGSGTLPFDHRMSAGPCTGTGKGTRALTVKGKRDLLRLELDVTAGAAAVSLTLVCPQIGSRSSRKQVAQPQVDHVVLPLPSTKPVRSVGAAGGPGIFYRFETSCEPAASGDVLLPVTTRPMPSAWATTVPTTLNQTIDDIRSRPFAKSNTLALTHHEFDPKKTLADRSKPAAGGGVCYWVEKVELDFVPIEMVLPTFTWSETTCEARATLEHEKKHVADLQGLLRDFSGELIRGIQGAGLPVAQRPRRVDSAAEGRAAALQRIEEIVEPARAKAFERRVAKAAVQDTPAEYARVLGQCPRGWQVGR